MNVVDCIISSSYHYYKCLDSLNNIAKEDDKYKFNSISNIFVKEQTNPILLINTVSTTLDYVLLITTHDKVFQTVVIIEKIAETDKEKEIMDKLINNPDIVIFHNSPGNEDFYSEDFFKSVIDKLNTNKLIPYLNVEKN